MGDRSRDFSLANDLAASHPEKLKELQALFLQEAVKYHVLPIDDRSLERLIPARAEVGAIPWALPATRGEVVSKQQNRRSGEDHRRSVD